MDTQHKVKSPTSLPQKKWEPEMQTLTVVNVDAINPTKKGTGKCHRHMDVKMVGLDWVANLPTLILKGNDLYFFQMLMSAIVPH